MSKKTYEELREKLASVPGAREFMARDRIGLAKQVLRLRKELNMTQGDVLDVLELRGWSMTYERLSEIEFAEESVELLEYDELINLLEGLRDEREK